MGFLDSIRRAIAGPPRIQGTGDEAGEVAAALHEEYAVPAPEEETTKIEELSADPQAGAPAGAGPYAAAPFVSPSADVGPEREAELDEPLETMEAESESEEDPVDPDNR